MSAGGEISGTPTGAPSAAYSFTVRAVDAFNCSGTRAYTFAGVLSHHQCVARLAARLGAICAQPDRDRERRHSTLHMGGVGGRIANGAHTLRRRGDHRQRQRGGRLPNYTLRATDANGCQGTRSYTMNILCPGLTMAPASLPNATQYASYSQTLTAGGGTAPYTWSITGGSLPTGMNLSTAGVLTGPATGAPAFITSPCVRWIQRAVLSVPAMRSPSYARRSRLLPLHCQMEPWARFTHRPSRRAAAPRPTRWRSSQARCRQDLPLTRRPV